MMKLRNVAVVLALLLGVSVTSTARLDAQQNAADLFNNEVLQRIDLDLHSADWARLHDNFLSNDYYPADLTWNGAKVRNVGIRSRGTGSRNASKPGLKVDFNQYTSGQTFVGLKSLVLDNLAQDPSGIHETVAMWFLSRFGIPAPREAHALLYVNGTYAGVYGVVEPIDKSMLTRVFGENDGYLYEFNKAAEWGLSYLGSDLAAYKPFFEPKTHESASDETLYRPIEQLVRLINEAAPEDLAERVGPYLDLDEVVRYVALQNFLSENDGFAGRWGTNNFYLYRLQQRDQHVLIAWDEDFSFADTEYDLSSYQDNNLLVQKLMSVPSYQALYLSTMHEAMVVAGQGAEVGALDAEIRREIELVDPALQADPARPSTATEYADARDFMRYFAVRRIRVVECELARRAGDHPCD